VRILYFSRDYTTHDHRFLSSLAESEYEVFYLRLERGARQLEDRPIPTNIIQVDWAGGKQETRWQDGPQLLGDLKRVIREVNPELIHAGPVQTCAFLVALTGFMPLVTMSWGSDLLKDSERSLLMRLVTWYTLRKTTLLIGDCRAVREKAVSFGFLAENSVLFPWGIDLKRFSPEKNHDFRERHGWEDAFVLLSLRSWESVYGVDVVVKGFIQAARQIPELRLVLLGNGSKAPEIHQLIIQAGMQDRVFFGGQVAQQDLPVFYQAADLYISASYSDGSSVSLMEALASGLPALVSDIPGNLEWVEPDKHGWLFPTGDAEALSATICKAVEQRDQLAQMGINARALAEKRADWRKNFQKLLDGYCQARFLTKCC
jgi:glycosyltransferase involved in cell wall biosynthesis